jgi:hypothetical protein
MLQAHSVCRLDVRRCLLESSDFFRATFACHFVFFDILGYNTDGTRSVPAT